MATVIDPNIPPAKPYWKIALDAFYRLLGVLKGMGVFTKGAGPKL